MSVDPDRAFLKSLKVLYVEDDETTRLMLRAFLARRVGVVVEASHGAEGLAAFEAERPDLVLTDIQMPVMDGLAMAAEIRARAPGVPIVVSTAFEEIAYLRRAIELGVEHYVTKPVDGAALETALLAVARRLRAEQALAREHQRQLGAMHEHHLEAIGLMAAGVAHDLNNLLQAIYGGVGLAEALAAPGSEQRELLHQVLESARQARLLGGNLLTIGRAPMHLTRGSVRTLVEETLREALAGSAVTLDVRMQDELPAIDHDDALLARALVEIARNAREAMSDRGVLHASAEVREVREGELVGLRAGRYVVLSLRDEGPGIADDALPRIFEPYFTSKPRGVAKGSGLGLALTRSIVRRHGGHVTAHSSRGGTTLVLYLPCSEEPRR